MAHDIFVSYSRRDLAAVKRIKEELESLGFSCWVDLLGIESGSLEFSRPIIDAIDGSMSMLFFLSADSQMSKWALKEIDYATGEKKHVVLVRFNDDPMTKDFRFFFGRTDIIDWRISEQKEKLLRDLRKWTGKTPPSGPSAQASGQVASSPPTGGFLKCPVCGEMKRPEKTFRCRECEREGICLRHRRKRALCPDCAKKAREARKEERAEKRAQRKAERAAKRLSRKNASIQ